MLRSTCSLALVGLLTSACTDRYQEGYEAGRIAGAIEARAASERACAIRVAEAEQACQTNNRAQNSPSFVTTEVCGGTGVHLNGKHYPGGKTGCVRVYSDGRVVRY